MITSHKDFKKLYKYIQNEISFEDFKIMAEAHNYTDKYIETMWEKWSRKPMEFLATHDLGETIFGILLNKQEVKKLLNKK